MGLYASVTASGLLFVHDPARNGPLVIALMLQVPCISSSLIVYRFAAGFDMCAAVGSTENASRVDAGFFWDFNFQVVAGGVRLDKRVRFVSA